MINLFRISLDQGVVLWLRCPKFVHYWPPTFPWLRLVKEFLHCYKGKSANRWNLQITYLARLVNVVKERPHQRELCEKPRLFGKAWAVVVLDKWLTSEICLNSCGVTKTALLASFVTTKWPGFLFMEGYGMVGAQSDTQCTIAYSQEFNLKIRFRPKFF